MRDAVREEGLDPQDWEEAQAVAHRMVDDAVAYLRGIGDGPCWRDPGPVEDAFREGLPLGPTPLGEVYEELGRSLMPYPMGNIHPRFWAWFMGAGHFTGALADFLAAVDGSNLGGGHTAPALVDRQVVRWLREMVGFPEGASGTLTNGGSAANLVALTVARNVKAAEAGVDVRAVGVAACPKPLRFYASEQVHSCHQKALEVLGLGREALHLVATDAAQRIDLAALHSAVAEDRARGLQPAAVIASAGTVNTGDFDDFTALAALKHQHGFYLHVDAAFGGFASLSPELQPLLEGWTSADSICVDLHKWLNVPHDAAVAFTRHRALQLDVFANTASYLTLNLDTPEPIHLAPESSHRWRALPAWFTLVAYGRDGYREIVERDCRLARRLGDRLAGERRFELLAPVRLNVIAFALRDQPERTAAFIDRLRDDGDTFVSPTQLWGRPAVRVALSNWQTTDEDVERTWRAFTSAAEAL